MFAVLIALCVFGHRFVLCRNLLESILVGPTAKKKNKIQEFSCGSILHVGLSPLLLRVGQMTLTEWKLCIQDCKERQQRAGSVITQ
jgi:hypothetical protein